MADERVAGWQARRAVAERARQRALARGDARLAEGLAAVVAGYDRWLARPDEGGLPPAPAPRPPVCSLVVRVVEDHPEERLPEPVLADVVVRLVVVGAPDRIAAEGVTDRAGQARFELAPGRYWLYVAADGDRGGAQLPDGRPVTAWRPIELRAGIARLSYLRVPPR